MQKDRGYRWPIAISVPRLLSAPNGMGVKIQNRQEDREEKERKDDEERQTETVKWRSDLLFSPLTSRANPHDVAIRHKDPPWGQIVHPVTAILWPMFSSSSPFVTATRAKTPATPHIQAHTLSNSSC